MYTGYRDCCSHHQSPPPCVVYYVPWPPPTQDCCDEVKVPRELFAAPATGQNPPPPVPTALISGSRPISLSLEMLVATGAQTPSVTVNTTTADGVNATWTDSTPAVGYRVKEAFLSVTPGTTVTLKVSNVTARLRWCETVCC